MSKGRIVFQEIAIGKCKTMRQKLRVTILPGEHGTVYTWDNGFSLTLLA